MTGASSTVRSTSGSVQATSGAVGILAENPSLESLRETNVNGCMKEVASPASCECGFDVFKESFAGQDPISPPSQGDPRWAALKQESRTRCGSKLIAEAVKGHFLAACITGDDAKSHTASVRGLSYGSGSRSST